MPKATDHVAKTLLADRVVYFKAGNPLGHVAFVTKVNSDHCAELVCYCPVSHAWFEACNVEFGAKDGANYFVNPEG